MIGMGVKQVQRNGDVVVLTPVWYRDCALVYKCVSFSPPMFCYLNVDEVPLLAVVECKLVLLGSEPLVVVNQSLHLVYTIKEIVFLVSQ